MTIGNAITFIQRGIRDADLRSQLNAASAIEDLDPILAAAGLSFSDHDFDEAYHNQLTLCAEADAADELREFKQWWDLLNQSFAPAGCAGTCSQCPH